jgi:hypothetical protein
MNLAAMIPAQYAKFITSLAGLLVVYLQLYGATWHLVPAVTAIGAALGVLGVPNAPKPAPPVPAARPAAGPYPPPPAGYVPMPPDARL